MSTLSVYTYLNVLASSLALMKRGTEPIEDEHNPWQITQRDFESTFFTDSNPWRSYPSSALWTTRCDSPTVTSIVVPFLAEAVGAANLRVVSLPIAVFGMKVAADCLVAAARDNDDGDDPGNMSRALEIDNHSTRAIKTLKVSRDFRSICVYSYNFLCVTTATADATRVL